MKASDATPARGAPAGAPAAAPATPARGAPAAAPAGAGGGGARATLDAVPATVKFQPPRDLDRAIPNPGMPRANVTVDKEHPQGAYAPPPDMTVLQQHVSFWARRDPAAIWPADTYAGFRALGFNALMCALAVVILHASFSWWSGASWVPHPGFPIYLAGIHRAKHGSDSESYDTEGRFVPQKFEEVFSKYGGAHPGGLTLPEIAAMLREARNVMDFFGWTAGALEWGVTYYLAAKEVPAPAPAPAAAGGAAPPAAKPLKVLTKDDARKVLDGTYFFETADAIAAGRLHRGSAFEAGLRPGAAPRRGRGARAAAVRAAKAQ